MKKNLFRTIALFSFTALVFGIQYFLINNSDNLNIDINNISNVLGSAQEILSPVANLEIQNSTPIISQKQIPTEKPVIEDNFSVSIEEYTHEIDEGGNVTFYWLVNGRPTTIKTTAVYFGKDSTPGNLTVDTAPIDTKYTDAQRDFINGNYNIPLKFIGYSKIIDPGIYYARAYARIGNNFYWSEEKSFLVKSMPKHDIKIVSYPQSVKSSIGMAFTWEITGPRTKTDYTTIVGSKESKSGILNETVDLNQTPYKILTKDFIGGSYDIPLRFVGNSVAPEAGFYYIRALAIVNGKYIWSEEQTMAVE